MVVLDNVHVVVGSDGRPAAVQVDIETWRKIIAALEDAEDVELARSALAELEAAGGHPERAGWMRLEELEWVWGAGDDV